MYPAHAVCRRELCQSCEERHTACVQLLSLSGKPGVTCGSPLKDWAPASSAGLLTTDTTPTAPSGPCCLTSGAAYTGQENQFYRIEIHQPGTPEGSAVPPASLAKGIATFKWSRDNGSVITAVSAITSVSISTGSVSQLTVQSLGRDQVLGFAPGNWVEVLDDATEFGQTYGELAQIDTIDVAAKTITLSKSLSGTFDPARHARIRRWDQSGKVYEQDGTTVWWDIDAQGSADIPLPPSGTARHPGERHHRQLRCEHGWGRLQSRRLLELRSSNRNRRDREAAERPAARYSIITTRRSPLLPSRPRRAIAAPTWPGSGGEECGCCCTYTVGDGVTSFGKYTSINDAINALPADTGGEVCILPGRYFENVFITRRQDVVLRGCGWQTRIASASLAPVPIDDAGTPVPAAAPAAAPASASSGASTFNAVITVSASQHVQLLSFAVEAAEDEVGVLIDGTGQLSTPPPPSSSGDGQVVFAAARIADRFGNEEAVTRASLVRRPR